MRLFRGAHQELPIQGTVPGGKRVAGSTHPGSTQKTHEAIDAFFAEV